MPQAADAKTEDGSEEHLLQVTEPSKPPVHTLVFSEDQLKALIEELKASTGLDITADNLEKLLAAHQVLLWLYRIRNYLAMATIPTYVIFQIKNSDRGLVRFLATLDPDIAAPGELTFAAGVFVSCISAALFGLLFSSKEKAYLSTVRLMYLPDRLKHAYHALIESPCPKLLQAALFICHESTLIGVNVTGSCSSIVDIFAILYSSSAVLAYLLCSMILYLGQAYNATVMDDDYYQGMAYLFDCSSKTPSLLQEVREGNFAIPFQILFQDLSAMALRLILYCFLAEASSNALGFWLPTYLIAAMVMLHSLFVLVPKTHQLYLNDKKAMVEAIQAEIKPECEQYKLTQPLATENELALDNSMRFLLKKDEYQSSALPQKDFLILLRKYPLRILLLLSRAGTGGYIGLKLAEAVNDNTNTEHPFDILILASSVLATAALLGCLLYRADAERLRYQLINQKNDAQKKSPVNEHKEEKTAATVVKRTACESFSDKSSLFINVVNSISIVASNVGLIDRLISLRPDLLPFKEVLLALGLLLSIDAAVNRGIYYQAKVEDTARRNFVPNSCSGTPSTQNGLYEKARNTARKFFASSCCVFFPAKPLKNRPAAQSSIQIEVAQLNLSQR